METRNISGYVSLKEERGDGTIYTKNSTDKLGGKMITVMKCKKCGKNYPLGETWCPFCGIRLMETVVENENDADVLMSNMNHEPTDEKLEPGIDSNAGLYSVLLGIFVVIICILGGVWGYGMFSGSIASYLKIFIVI